MLKTSLSLAVCFALLLAPTATGCAQGKREAVKRAKPTVRPTKAEKNGWREYVSDKGRFKVSFPAEPEVETNQFGTTSVTDFKVDQSGAVVWTVNYADEPKYKDDEPSLKEAYARSVAALQREDRKLISVEEIRLNGHLGIEYVLEGPASTYRTRVFMKGNRLYQVSFKIVGSPASEKAHLTGEVNDFLNSFNFW